MGNPMQEGRRKGHRSSAARAFVLATVIGMPFALSEATASADSPGVYVEGSNVVFVAANGDANNLEIRMIGTGTVEFTERSGLPISVGPGCVRVSNPVARCTPLSVHKIWVHLGDRSDNAISYASPDGGVLFFGGDGDDYLTGGNGPDMFCAGAGNDVIFGTGGTDLLAGSAGADFFSGGGDSDTVTYRDDGHNLSHCFVPSFHWRGGVTADLDGRTGDDGEAGEGDTIASDVENLEGGVGNDTLIGNASSNFLNGWWGLDYVNGRSGTDLCFAEYDDECEEDES